MNRRTLIGVWAHPDDEAYLSAGLMASYTARGDRVVVVTATLGELGTSDPATWPPERLASRRLVELRAALAAVGVHELHVLGFADGACETEDGTAAIATHIASLRPDIVVTFGPDGMTGHPDHKAVSRWTTNAWSTTRSSAQLWYATVTPVFHDRWGALNRRIGLWADQPEPPNTPQDELCHAVSLSGRLLDTKIAALRAHASQTAPLIELMGEHAYRRWWATEAFRAATPSDLATALPEGAGAARA